MAIEQKFIKDINKAQRNLAELKREVVNKRVFHGLAKLARSIIWKRVKSGKGASGGKTQRLAPLQQSTIDVRSGKGIMRTFKTSGGRRTVFIPGVDGRPSSTGQFFSAKRSNLTFSGQMLDSITFRVKSPFGFTLFIPDSRRQPYKNNDVMNKKAPPSNRDVAIFVQSGRSSPTRSEPRPFFELTKGETRIIIKQYNDIIKNIIRRKGL